MTEDQEVNPTWMFDCMVCSAQRWALDEHTDRLVRIRCNDCGAKETYMLTDEESGANCVVCEGEEWSVVEIDEGNHVVLVCDGCNEQAEAWLRE